MAEKFKDAEGREYSIDLKAKGSGAWRKLRAMKDVGFSLESMDDGIGSVVAIDALLIVTEAQRKRLDVDEDEFASAITPEVGPALSALLREVLRFFRQEIPAELQPDVSQPETANSSTA